MSTEQHRRDLECANLRIWVRPNRDDAGFRLIVNVVDNSGRPTATVGSCDDSDSDRLHTLLHAYRMGQRFAPEHVPEVDP